MYTPGSDITIPSVKNFDSVMILQLARDKTNGNADTNLCAFGSTGEFLLFGNSAATDAKIKIRADDPVGTPAGTVAGISSVYISIGGIQYPSQPIDVSRSTGSVDCLEPSGLWHEYGKGINRYARREVAPAIPYDMFRTTMPFIYLRPWASDAPKPSAEGKDLIIRMRGGVAGNISVVVFTYHVHTLAADGVAKDY